MCTDGTVSLQSLWASQTPGEVWKTQENPGQLFKFGLSRSLIHLTVLTRLGLKGRFCMWAAQSLAENILELSEGLINTPLATSLWYVANNSCFEIRSLSQNWQRISISFLPSQQQHVIFPDTSYKRASAALSIEKSCWTCLLFLPWSECYPKVKTLWA